MSEKSVYPQELRGDKFSQLDITLRASHDLVLEMGHEAEAKEV